MRHRWTVLGLGLALTAGCNQLSESETRSKLTDTNRAGFSASEEDDDGEDQNVALAVLPAAVRAAVLATVSGLVLESAELEVEGGVTIYSVEGSANGVEYCIEVSPDGKVLKTETEDDEDDDDGD